MLAHFLDHAHRFIRDGDRVVPAVPGNVDYDALVAAGTTIAPYAAPSPGDDDVRAEAHRRVRAVVGATDNAHLAIILADNERELRVLVEAGQGAGPRAAEIRALDTAIEAVWGAYNALAAPYPVDYADDRHWPAG